MEENKMGVMPIGKLIVTMSLPIMISMLVQALYNVVDSVFVARIDEYALTAVSMAFPIQNLMIAVSVGTAVGVNALLARYLGAKDYEKVNKIAENAVFSGNHELPGVFIGRTVPGRAVLQKPDRYRRNRAIRPTVYFHLLLSVFWCLYPDYV